MQYYDISLTISPCKTTCLVVSSLNWSSVFPCSEAMGKIQSESGIIRIQIPFLDNVVKLTLVKSSSEPAHRHAIRPELLHL